MIKVLIVIDMQSDFVTGVLGSAAALAVVPGIQALARTYREAGQPVLFTMDTHEEKDYGGNCPTQEEAKIPKHCIRGTKGWEIVPELVEFARDDTVEKPAFLSKTLADEIKKRCNGQEDLELTLCGVCTDICVVSNALSLRERFPKASIRVLESCCAGTSPQNHAAALAVMGSCLVEVVH